MNEIDSQPIILASQSPRRAALLREAGIAFEVVVPRELEPEPQDWPFSDVELAEIASYFKARCVAEDYPDRVVLAADTVVALEGRIFGKPADADDARRILSTLAGTTQDVITGVAICQQSTGRRLVRHDVTRVTMRAMSAEQIDAYIQSGAWQGKAGAYGIQDSGDAFIEKVEGSFTNVVGLPMELVTAMLAEFGVR